MKNPGIYILTNKFNGKQYIGKDVNLPRRANDHLKGWAKNCPAIHAAIKKYGADNFSLEIIRYPGISHEALYSIEQWKIRQLTTKAPYGYNLTDGGAGSYGREVSIESREKQSKSLTGYKHSPEARANMAKAQKGRKHSPEARANMAKAMKGKKRSPEACANISRSKIGNIPWNKGKTGIYSEETLKKISEASKGRIHSKETRKKMSLKGKLRHYNNRQQRLKESGQLFLFEEDT